MCFVEENNLVNHQGIRDFQTQFGNSTPALSCGEVEQVLQDTFTIGNKFIRSFTDRGVLIIKYKKIKRVLCLTLCFDDYHFYAQYIDSKLF